MNRKKLTISMHRAHTRLCSLSNETDWFTCIIGLIAFIQGGPKIGTISVRLITSSNIDQFSNPFH